MDLFRVFNYIDGAAEDAPGGAKFIPPQGAGRLDNPESYRLLYTSRQSAGAVAETFNRGPNLHSWGARMLRPALYLRGSVRALAAYELSDALHICDLDDGSELAARTLRPSSIVTRDYSIAKAWALRIYQEARWAGIGWWSRMDSRWANVAIWDITRLKVVAIEPLGLDHPAIIDAADVLEVVIS